MADTNEYMAGQVQIANEVVEIIAATAASEVNGVVSPIAGGTAQKWTEFFGKKNPSKGVKLQVEEGHVTIDLSITVRFGTKLMEAAAAVQQKVKNAVETMTNYVVDAVNVDIDAVVVDRLESKTEAE